MSDILDGPTEHLGGENGEDRDTGIEANVVEQIFGWFKGLLVGSRTRKLKSLTQGGYHLHGYGNAGSR